MRKTLAILAVFGALGAGAVAGGISVSLGYNSCGRSYYRPSYYGYYRSPVVVYPSRTYCYRPTYRNHYYHRPYSHCYRPPVVYVPHGRRCR